MPDKKFIALALDEDQCRAVLAACTTAVVNIERDITGYDEVLKKTGKTGLELMGLYTSVVMYVSDKLVGIG